MIVKVVGREIALLPDNKQWTNRFEVGSDSSDRVYVIAQRRDGSRVWACSCPGWIRWRKCKHLTRLDVGGVLKALTARTG